VAISPRLLGTLSGQLFSGLDSLSADRDPFGLLRFHSDLVYQNGATHIPAMTTPFRPSRGSFQTGRCPTTSLLAPNRAPRMGSPLSVPHVAPLDSPIGRWDRQCRVCSQGAVSSPPWQTQPRHDAICHTPIGSYRLNLHAHGLPFGRLGRPRLLASRREGWAVASTPPHSYPSGCVGTVLATTARVGSRARFPGTLRA